MNTTNTKFDFNDISIIPAVLSEISSRKECDYLIDGKLPIFVAPMDMVIDENNIDKFIESNLNICVTRNFSKKYDDVFYAYSLNEIRDMIDKNTVLSKKVLIDVANGHSVEVFNLAKEFKQKFDNELMVGNIANPETYLLYDKIGVDYIRCSIGTGSACLSSVNTAINYPLASLISDIYDIKRDNNCKCKIIADGGFKNYSDIIKALALGADYVMLGSIFNKCFESCSDNYFLEKNKYVKISDFAAKMYYKQNIDIYKYYRGMSTKEVQRKWNKTEIKTAEGTTMYNKIEYTLSGWIENFIDYLRSSMSYTGSKNLLEFKKSKFVKITEAAYKRFNK